jgi:hypothetical protein
VDPINQPYEFLYLCANGDIRSAVATLRRLGLDELTAVWTFFHLSTLELPFLKRLRSLLRDSNDEEPNNRREQERDQKANPEAIAAIVVPSSD